jgi:hypothetical protein
MAGALNSATLAAPGFYGLNSQESGITLESGYALTTANCIIDRYGRLGARRGWRFVTTNNGSLDDTDFIEWIYEFKNVDGNITYLSAGANKLYSGTATLVEKSIRNFDDTDDLAVSITDNNWKGVSLPNGAGLNALGQAFVGQRGHPLLMWNKYDTTFIYQRVFDVGAVPTGFNATTFDPNELLASFGRVWAADLSGNKTTVYYSVILDGSDFDGVGSGFIDIASQVGNNDEIVALANHNGFLVIFCKNNIVVYQNPDDVDNIVLADVISGVGCISRDSVQTTGTDIIFLSQSGVRSLSRTIQEKSMPMRELSLNIRDELVEVLNSQPNLDKIKGAYFERDAFYLLALPATNQIYCFDTRTQLPNAAARVTTWEEVHYTAFCSTLDRRLLLGVEGGIGEYFGYQDNGEPYRMRYFTNFFDFGQATQLKLLKQIGVVTIGGSGQDFVVKYGFDYSTNYQSAPLKLPESSELTEYNLGEYNIGEYSGGIVSQAVKVNVGGSGKVIQLGFEADIDGYPLSIQKIDCFIKTGKLL